MSGLLNGLDDGRVKVTWEQTRKQGAISSSKFLLSKTISGAPIDNVHLVEFYSYFKARVFCVLSTSACMPG